MSGWIFISMIPAAALLMLHFGIGPFAHAKWKATHLRWRASNAVMQKMLIVLATLVLMIGVTHLLGIWSFEQ